MRTYPKSVIIEKDPERGIAYSVYCTDGDEVICHYGHIQHSDSDLMWAVWGMARTAMKRIYRSRIAGEYVQPNQYVLVGFDKIPGEMLTELSM